MKKTLNKYFSESELYNLVAMLRSSKDDCKVAFAVIDGKKLPRKDKLKLFKYISNRTPPLKFLKHNRNSIEFLYNVYKMHDKEPFDFRLKMGNY